MSGGSPNEVVANEASTLPARLYSILSMCRLNHTPPPKAFRNKLVGPHGGYIALTEQGSLKVVVRFGPNFQSTATEVVSYSVESVWRSLYRIGIAVPKELRGE